MGDNLPALYAQFYDRIDSLEDQGIIASVNIDTYHLRDPMKKGSHFYKTLFPILCRGSEFALDNMHRVLESPTWNYDDLADDYIRMRLCAECMGAFSLVQTVGTFELAFLAGVRDVCFSLMSRMRQEYLYVRQQFENLVELVHRISFMEQMCPHVGDDSDSCISSDSDCNGDN